MWLKEGLLVLVLKVCWGFLRVFLLGLLVVLILLSWVLFIILSIFIILFFSFVLMICWVVLSCVRVVVWVFFIFFCCLVFVLVCENGNLWWGLWMWYWIFWLELILGCGVFCLGDLGRFIGLGVWVGMWVLLEELRVYSCF